MAKPAVPVQEGLRAAQYARMSTEHQRYSISYQTTAIELYAKARGYELVASYADEGISGLDIKRRTGLKQLLSDVIQGDCGFETILVYDVSRWGRFQNPDQSAHYEFLCAQAGVRVEYCAELFENDGSLTSTLLKSLKRVMAAEYSRELSTKTAAAKTARLHDGFWQGGSAGYGLRRQMFGPDGAAGPVLEFGQSKAVQDHHTVLVPGPPQEIAIVQRIYRMFTDGRMSQPKIAKVLNAEGVIGEGGKVWTPGMVFSVLTSPKYLGDLVGNRTVGLLGAPRVPRDEGEWVRKPRAFEPIVARKLFLAAQARIDTRRKVSMSRSEMLDVLRAIYAEHGKITRRLIDERPATPCSNIFYRTFGRQPGVHAAIGAPMKHRPRRAKVGLTDDEIIERLTALRERAGYLNKKLVNEDGTLPGTTTIARRFGALHHAFLRAGFITPSHRDRGTAIGRARLAAALAAFKPSSSTS